MQLIVTANKLNKRSSAPANLSEKNIVGVVLKGFRFQGEEVSDVPNPSLGKWYKDRDGSYYWGGGLIVERSINLPSNLPERFQIGVDVSHHNDAPDWPAIAAAGVEFAYIKISEGVGTPDRKANEHATNAKKNGLQIGYYHFGRPDEKNGGTLVNDATAEADEAMRIMNGLTAPDLPLVVDLEDETGWDTPLSKSDYNIWVSTFINRVREVSGKLPIIYSRKGYLDDKLPSDHALGSTMLWIANYSVSDCSKVMCPTGWQQWNMWQFTESAAIGKTSKIDVSIKRT